jgi:hypothetical protein
MIKINNMKKLLFILAITAISCTAAKQIIVGKKLFDKKSFNHFSVDGEMVMYDNKPIAKYQAKTYSLDGGELVEEYNLLLLDNNITNKQLIGDLIDFVSDRHQGAEVEVEIDSHNSAFKL